MADLSPTLAYRYHVAIRIAGTVKVDDVECWRVKFTAGPDRPAFMNGESMWVAVAKESGEPMDVTEVTDGGEFSMGVGQIGRTRLMLSLTSLYPYVVFIRGPDRDVSSPESITVAHFQSEMVGRERKYSYWVNSGPLNFQVNQVWHDKERWWRSYEVYRYGELDLRATVLDATFAADSEVKPSANDVQLILSDGKPQATLGKR